MTKYHVKDPADLPDDTVIICTRWSNPPVMPDNVRSVCSCCGAAIQTRPHNPPKVTKICLQCAMPLMIEQAKSGEELEIAITPETAREVADHLKKQKN
jgi:hypothetical protein